MQEPRAIKRYGQPRQWWVLRTAPLTRWLQRPVAPADWRLSLALVLLVAVYLWPMVYRNWIPHDQGILAQSAQRVLAGQLPHRDFDELYTGGLSYLHAVAFSVWGMKLSAIRSLFLLAALSFTWVQHRTLRRVTPPGIAELTLLASLAWGLANYFEGMPSWYNLFCIVFGLACLLQYFDTGRRRWVAGVGCWGGAGLLIKIVGLYYVAAMLLVLAVDVGLSAAATSSNASTDHRSRRVTRWFLVGVTAAISGVWLILVVLMTRRNMNGALVVHLIVPSLATCVAAIGLAVRYRDACWQPIQELAVRWLVFGLGLLLPVGIFLIPYAASAALDDLFRGLFVLPFTRLTGATYPFPDGATMLALLTVWAAAGGLWLLRPQWDRDLALVAVAATGLLMALPYWLARELVLQAARGLLPVVAVTCSLWLVYRGRNSNLTEQRQLLALLCLASFCSLSQFPFAAPIYFCFIAPLYLLLLQRMLTVGSGLPVAASKAASSRATSSRACAWMVGGLGLLLGLVYVNRFSMFDDPRAAFLDPPQHLLDVPRGGLLVSRQDQQTYRGLVAEIQQQCASEQTLLATPDCPEVYFLSERDNPTRTFLEFFEAPEAQPADSAGKFQQQLQRLQRLDVQVLVIHLAPRHSPPLDDETIAQLAAQFARQVSIGNFLVCSQPHYSAAADSRRQRVTD